MGFHQVPVKDVDRPKTAFVSPWGKYQYRYMPFGLCDAPAMFQRFFVLRDVWNCSRAYIDDIVIFSGSWEHYCLHLVFVLEKIRDAGLILKAAKCEWGIASYTYLGFIVGHGRRRPEDVKVDAIRKFPIPKLKSQVRSFLGLTGYYRDLVPKYASNSFHQKVCSRCSGMDNSYGQRILLSANMFVCLCIPVPSDCFSLKDRCIWHWY